MSSHNNRSAILLCVFLFVQHSCSAMNRQIDQQTNGQTNGQTSNIVPISETVEARVKPTSAEITIEIDSDEGQDVIQMNLQVQNKLNDLSLKFKRYNGIQVISVNPLQQKQINENQYYTDKKQGFIVQTQIQIRVNFKKMRPQFFQKFIETLSEHGYQATKIKYLLSKQQEYVLKANFVNFVVQRVSDSAKDICKATNQEITALRNIEYQTNIIEPEFNIIKSVPLNIFSNKVTYEIKMQAEYSTITRPSMFRQSAQNPFEQQNKYSPKQDKPKEDIRWNC